MKENLSSSKVVVHNAAFNLLGFVVSAAYVFFLIPVVVKYLGVEQFGLWSLMLALTGYISLADLGLSTSFIKFVAEFVSTDEHAKVNKVIQQGSMFYIALTAVLIMVGMLVFSTVFMLLKIPEEQFGLGRNIFMLSLVGFGVTSVSGVLAGVLMGIQRTDVFNKLVVVSYVVRFVVILIVLANGGGLPGLMISDIAVGIAFMLPLWLATKKYCPYVSLRFTGYDHPLMKSLLLFGFQLQVSRFAELVQAQFDKLLIARYVNLGGVSMYDFGSRPLGRIRSFPVTAVSSLVPAISSLHAEREAPRIEAALLRGTRYLMIFALPMFTFCMCFAHELVHVWLGEGFDQAAVVLQILAPGYFVGVVVSVLALISQGMGEPKTQMYAMMVQVGLNILLSFSFIMFFGFFGAVVGTAVSATFGGLLFFHWYGRRLVKRPLMWLLRIALKPVVSILPAIAGGLGIVALMHTSGSFASRPGILFVLAIGGVVFLSVYVLMVLATKTLTSDDRGFFINIIPNRFAHLLR